MMTSDYWDADTAARYDETSAFMFDPEVLGPAVDFLADLAGDGPALELAIGTGRVAIPLADLGVPVTGIDICRAPAPGPSPARSVEKVDRRAEHLRIEH